MSSATSIDKVLPPDRRRQGSGGPPKLHAEAEGGSQKPGEARGFRLQAEETPAPFRVWHFFVLVSLLAATIAVVLARQATPEHLILLSLTIGAAGAAGVGVYRMLAPLAASDAATISEPLSESTRATLEREKALALRSIKELEFDRAMGKVSARDFDEMAGRLRARAMTIMRQLDQGGAYRELIERELQARLGNAAPTASARATAVRRSFMRRRKPRVCEGCGTRNDADAAFCKKCGDNLRARR